MTTGKISRARFLMAAGAVAAAPLIAAEPAGAAGRRAPVRHGVCYAVGDGDVAGTGWTAARMRADLRAIACDLHANAISVYGTGPDRLAATAAEAAERGLSVWLQPRLGDLPPADILDHVAETGRRAERLRRGGARVVLSVGCEFVLFVPSIVPGADVLERVRNLMSGNFDPVIMQRRLTAFTARAARVGRSVFRGRLTYGAAHDEQVDWSLFDMVGVNYYGDRPRRDLAPVMRLGKPVAVTEFGCCTYEGAAADGGMGWDVVDYTKEPPEIRGNLVRSEETQARYLTDRLGDFASMNLAAALVYDFVSPDAPYRRNPRYDMDLASYSIVRTIWADGTDPANGWHWEPKRAFHALARRFAAA
ncbi:hypothetical protein AB0M20_27180 [Actinoplanes sp. NPDC051633]|uniref:hypothetical protein n=1 Tax=Actinoplanes sp. NPDC051633 TaxID=3155670 RepID=UPI0034424243